MIKKISRDICLIKYRKLPLCEYEKETDLDICYYPERKSFYWIKLEDKSVKNVSKEIVQLIKNLGVKNVIFLGQINKPWISRSTANRKDFKPLLKVLDYFKSHKIEKKFNGGVMVGIKELEKFVSNLYVITKCDGGFFDFHFTDENQSFIFHIHYSGEIKVFTLSEESNDYFLDKVRETKFIDSMLENSTRIK